MQRMAPTDIADEHGYRGRRSFPQIAQMNTDTGIYKICEICGRINLKQQKESPTDSTDEHGYWVRRSLPQIARMNTDIGIYRICEYLWNPWENKSQTAEAISNRQHRGARIMGYIKSVNICGIRGRINLKQQRLSPTYLRKSQMLAKINKETFQDTHDERE